mgnify:CR=1 FL=1
MRKYDYHAMTADYVSGLTYEQAAKKHGVSTGTVWRAVKLTIGGGRSVKDAVLRGADHPFWTGGTTQNHRGYIETSNGMLLHRVVAERRLGRSLEHWEAVHHIDDDKQNNEDRNLAVIPGTEHSRFHLFLRHRSLPVNRETLLKFCLQEQEGYFRFTKAIYASCVAQEPSTSPIRMSPVKMCRNKSCGAEVVSRSLCSKHYQRYMARSRGYWCAGAGRRAQFTGKRQPLSPDDVRQIRLLRNVQKITLAVIAEQFGKDISTISLVARGVTWRDVQ